MSLTNNFDNYSSNFAQMYGRNNGYNNRSRNPVNGNFVNNQSFVPNQPLNPQIVEAAQTIVNAVNSNPNLVNNGLGAGPSFGNNRSFNQIPQNNGFLGNQQFPQYPEYTDEAEEFDPETRGGAKKKTKKSYDDDKPKAKKATKKTSPKKSAPKTKKTGGSPNPYRRR